MKKIHKKSKKHQIDWYLIWGKEDRVISPKSVEVFQKKFPQAKANILPTGHLVVDREPEAVREILDSWILSHNTS